MNKILRTLLGTAAVAAVGAIALVPTVPFAVAAGEISPQTVSVDPNPLQISCPGAFIEVGGESGTELGSVERRGEASVGAAQPEWQPATPLITGFTELIAEGTVQSTELLSANQTQYVDRQRARGIAATFCEQPSSSGWFISGQSSVGAETVLLMHNPNQVDTQVIIRYHLPGGMSEQRYALAAGEEQFFSLAAEAGLEPSYAIEYESLGAPISMALQHRYSRGLTPLGVDLSMASSVPARDQWITPVQVVGEGYQPALLRLFAPGNAAEVIVTAFSDADPQLFRVLVPTAGFTELALELPNGLYALKLESDSEVLAGVLNPSLEPLDQAWIYPSNSFNELTMAVPQYQSELVLTNPNALAISANLTLQTGQRRAIQSVQIEPLSSVSLPVSADSLSIVSANQFYAALQISDPLGYALIAPSENRNLGSEMEIRVR